MIAVTPVGRDGRHAGGDARWRASTARRWSRSINVVGSAITRGRGRAALPAGRPGDRVASTKAFVTTHDGALPAGAVLAAAMRGTLRARTSAQADAARRCRRWPSRAAHVAETPARPTPYERLARRLHEEQATSCSSGAAPVPDRAGGGAEAEGDLVHPRRGLPGGRDEARADRADRRRTCRVVASRRRRTSTRRSVSNVEEVKARDGDGDRRSPPRATKSIARPCRRGDLRARGRWTSWCRC